MQPLARLFILILGLWLTHVCVAAAQEEPAPRVAQRAPQMASVFPMGARPGASLPVELRGEYLDRAERAVFSRPDISAAVKKASFSRVQLEVRVSADAEPGPRYFRLLTPRGATNLLLFRVSQWPTAAEDEPNNDFQNLPLVEWPVLISGQIANQRDVDLFRFHAKAGQALNLSVLGARNWSGADLSLAILDSSGRAVQQDEGRLIWDPHINFLCPRDGDYAAAVMLTRMPAGGQSRNDLVYQLAIGHAPLLLSAFPLFLRTGETASLQVRGEFLDPRSPWSFDGGELAPRPSAAAQENVRVPGPTAVNLSGSVRAKSPGVYALSPKDPSGLVAPLTVLVSELPIINESAKNDDLGTAQPITLPVVVNGKIESDWDEDLCRFEAQAGDALVFSVDSEKWGSPLDARLTLLDAKGKIVVANDDAKIQGRPLNRDPKIEHKFKEAGTYYVKVHSLQRRGGEDYVYALTARRQSPGFALSLGAERLAVRRGEKAGWNVAVERQEGFQGEIDVEIQGLPAGVQAQPLHLKGDQASGSLSLVAAADAPLGAAAVEVVARAAVDGAERVVKAQAPAARITGHGPGFANYKSTEGWLAVVEPPLFSLESAASEVFLVRGGSAEFGVKVVRRPEAKGELEFELENAPEGVSIENVEMVDQGRMARLTLRASKTAATGRVSDVVVVGTFAANGARRSESAPRINLQVD